MSLQTFIVTHNCGQTEWQAEDIQQALGLHEIYCEVADVPGGTRAIHGCVRKSVEHTYLDKPGRLPADVRRKLVDATKCANLERCALDFTEDQTRYLDTWVTHRLREILRWDAGEITAVQLNENYGW